MNFTFDYTKCMMTKLLMAVPDCKGGSILHCDCDRALEIIGKTDRMTPGIRKIVYLVGWQYCGHDDKYPAFFEVNDAIKGKSDNALDALIKLMNEAEKFNTTVSLHVNFTDAYEDSPLFEAYVKNNALIRNRSGKPAGIEKYNGKTCYKISYKEEWNSGLFTARADRLLRMLPIERAGTIHVDNFQCYVNKKPFVSAQEETYYRDKMIKYFRDRGIDITTEFNYREGSRSALFYGKIVRDVTPKKYPMATLGKVPALWWVDKMTKSEYFAYYPHVIGGGMPKSGWARNLFYGNVHCEDVWLKKDWEAEFIRQFVTVNVPYFYLNGKRRVGFADRRMREVAYEDGTIAKADGTIVSEGICVKKGGNVFLPCGEGYYAYSKEGGILRAKAKRGRAYLYEIASEGFELRGEIETVGGILSIDAKKDTPYYVSFADISNR